MFSYGRVKLLVLAIFVFMHVLLLTRSPQIAAANPIGEVEPNNTAQTAQSLASLGADDPVNAQANAVGDIDWYKFEVVAGRTYVVELFNVVRAFEANGNGCTTFVVGSTGIGLEIYDSTVTKILAECGAKGAGNVHRYVQFKAGLSGPYYVKVLPANPNVIGSYSLRVLPHHNEPDAVWNSLDFEPNNALVNAYGLKLGAANSITSSIEERNSSYLTNAVDIDWYRFEAVAGQTYVVELYNVPRAFDVNGNGCTTFVGGSSGIGLSIFDSSATQVLAQCNPTGSGNVHHLEQFKAGLSGTYYIKVAPGGDNTSGSYSLRILPSFDNSAASWDSTTFEPNNAAINAYLMKIGPSNGLSSTIEERNSSFSTNKTDQDWYRFEAVVGETYTVQLFNVVLANDGDGNGCTTFVVGSRGIGLEIYDPLIARVVAECSPNGKGGVYHQLQFKAGLNGTYYVHVAPGGNSVWGSYSLRVRTSNDQYRTFVPLAKR